MKKDIRHFVLETKELGTFDVVEYKEYQELQKRIDNAIEYINEYAWQEDIIGDMWTTTGEPVKDRYMRLEWDNCNELLEILKGEDKE